MTSYSFECVGDITVDGIMPSSSLRYADMTTGDVLVKTHPDSGDHTVYLCNFARDGEAIHIPELNEATGVHMHDGLIVWSDIDEDEITCYDTKTRSIRYILDARNYMNAHSVPRGLEDKFCIINGKLIHTFDLASGDLLESHVVRLGEYIDHWSVNPLVVVDKQGWVKAASLAPYTPLVTKFYLLDPQERVGVGIVRPGHHIVMIGEWRRLMLNVLDGARDETFYIDQDLFDDKWAKIKVSDVLCTDHDEIVLINLTFAIVVYDLRSRAMLNKFVFAPGERMAWYDNRLVVTLTSKGSTTPGFTLRKYRLVSADTKAARKLQ